MDFNFDVLDNTEKITIALRSLYSKYGYQQFRMSKFEEYDLYSDNRDFLVSDRVITFTDTNGKLMALKPDVTLSIIKNGSDTPYELQKLYYKENVYRAKETGYREITQVGLECIGNVDPACIGEVIALAAESLAVCTDDYAIELSHLGLLTKLIDSVPDTQVTRNAILKCVSEKNVHGIYDICTLHDIPKEYAERFEKLLSIYGKPGDIMDDISAFAAECGVPSAFDELKAALCEIAGTAAEEKVIIDFSAVCDTNYYNGIVFKGFINGIPESVLSGGQYDKLMEKMKRRSKAIGFAVYLDVLGMLETPIDNADTVREDSKKKLLNIALPKGRLGEKAYSMFEKAGFACPSINDGSRKLIFENEEVGVRYFWAKPSDVAIYVERGAADIGVVGKDILTEYEPDLYELLDLDIGKCRMAVAAPKDFKDDTERPLRVATKFSGIAQAYYASRGRDIDIVHLNGSIEIAPILDLTDVIVDIVETGTTLKENDLEVKETIMPISARLISNKASFKFKNEAIEQIVREIVKETDARK